MDRQVFITVSCNKKCLGVLARAKLLEAILPQVCLDQKYREVPKKKNSACGKPWKSMDGAIFSNGYSLP
jgi:hypothetical protein